MNAGGYLGFRGVVSCLRLIIVILLMGFGYRLYPSYAIWEQLCRMGRA